jgi:hypothetical protein
MLHVNRHPIGRSSPRRISVGPARMEAVRAALLVVLAYVAIGVLLPVVLTLAGSAPLP